MLTNCCCGFFQYNLVDATEVIAAALQADKIVVDTVLIGPSNNVAKAISVATGGCCFVPQNMQAAQVTRMMTIGMKVMIVIVMIDDVDDVDDVGNDSDG